LYVEFFKKNPTAGFAAAILENKKVMSDQMMAIHKHWILFIGKVTKTFILAPSGDKITSKILT